MDARQIEFFEKESGEVRTNHEYFVLNGEVWRDNYNSYESQPAVIGFENFVVRVPEIGWRIATHTAELAAGEAEIARLRTALQDIAENTDPDNGESYRADDREGCLDAMFATASAALTKQPPTE